MQSSIIALLMAFDLREETRWSVLRRLGSAAVMGLAVSAMHYTGMAAASFMPASAPDLSYAVSISPLVNNGIAIVTLAVILAAMATSSVDRRSSVEVGRLNQELERRVAERTEALTAANERLIKSESRLREYERVVEALEEMIVVVDREYHYVIVNRAFLAYRGMAREEVVGRLLSELIDRQVFERVIKSRLEECFQGKVVRFETKYIYPALGERDLFLSYFPIEGPSGITRAACILQDITERKRAEQALQEAQAELAHVTRVLAMGELVTSIAHEVNQPLTAVVTNGNFALRQVACGAPNLEELREAITEIVNDGARASEVIKRVRTLLKKGSPDRVDLDINQVIREVGTLVQNVATRHRVSVRLDLAADLPPVPGDGVQLQQVLINLIMNAIDAMRKVTDRRRELVIKSAKNVDGLLIQVRDSGEGIDPQQADRIFEPFFTTKPQGIGMGLSISRSIIESHGGRLRAVPSSTGALFEFTLPTDGAGAS